ncbi:MAG: dNTP triphosphohydrolase [Ruminococcus sp.]|nr:dNTP triphosphohydrolase [Ruminococcus sp.]
MSQAGKLAADLSTALRCSELVHDSSIYSRGNRYRNKFMSDRDKIMYCRAFLRLSGKTQVYTPSSGSDHRRTRLTHTLEVSQIARTIAKALDLDCDLTEAIALGHDIGHTPFGHAGERILHEIMSPPNIANLQIPKTTSTYKIYEQNKDDLDALEDSKNEYGFKHNLQSVRCLVEDMDMRGNDFGLNLTNYTLWGIMNHSNIKYKEARVSTDFVEPLFYKQYEKYCSHKDGSPAWTFEALIVREADEIAQMHHDLEDSIRNKVMSYCKVIELIQPFYDSDLMSNGDKKRFDELKSEIQNTRKISKEHFISTISKIVVNTLVTVLVNSSDENLVILGRKHNFNLSRIFSLDVNSDDIKNAISYDIYGENKNKAIIDKFKSRMSTLVLYTHDVQRSDSKGKYIIKNLFEAYYTNPQQLPDTVIRNTYRTFHMGETADIDYMGDIGEIRHKFESDITSYRRDGLNSKDICLMRMICDYIAGMTDNFAINEYEKLYG